MQPKAMTTQVRVFAFALVLNFLAVHCANADSFTNTGSMITARYWGGAALLPNGKVLVTGGLNSTNGNISSAELYDPSTGIWTATGSMNNGRNNFTANLLPNGKVLVAGGYNYVLGHLSSAELYDPATGLWTTTGALNTARNWHTAVLLPNGKVLIAGGQDANNNDLSSAEIYDPATEAWTVTGAMNVTRHDHTETLLANGKVLVAGGSSATGGYLNSAELYDPASGAWTLTSTMNTSPAYHTATLLPNGKVLVAGGVSGGSFLSSAELYDPVTGTWTLTSAMTNARAFHTATLLPNGKVLVAGGLTPTGNTSSAELFDFVTGTWTPAGSMSNARNHQTATLLLDGELLIAGGTGDSITLNGAELYGDSLDNGLVAYYPFNGNANDASGNGNNGIVYGASLATDRFGNASGCYGFSGSGEWIRANIGPSYFAADFAISVWVNFSDFANDYPMIVSGDTYFVHCHGLGPIYANFGSFQKVVYYGGSVSAISSTNTFATNCWYHLCITRNGSNTLMFVNGSVAGQDIHAPIAPTTGSYLQIGNDFTGGTVVSSFHGELDDMRIYNRALSSSEVQALYASESSNPKSVINGNIQTSSTLTLTPASAPADGQSNVTATVTLLNSINNPVAGKTVKFISSRSTTDTIKQPTSPTDANGRATATITTTTPGTAAISATDQSDGAVVNQQQTVTFTQQSLVPLSATLNGAINSFSLSSSNTLNKIAALALDEGTIGDNFHAQINNAGWSGLFDVFSTIGLDKIIPDPNGFLAKTAVKLGEDIGGQVLGDLLTDIALNPHGLSNGGVVIADDCASNRLVLQGQMLALQNGVPQSSINNTATYTNDLPLRLAANNVLSNILQQQDLYLNVINSTSQLSQNLTGKALTEAGYVGYALDVVSLIPAIGVVAKPTQAVYSAALLAANLYELTQTYDVSKVAYKKTFSLLSACSDYAAQIATNESQAYSEIAQGVVPTIAKGSVINASTVQIYNQVAALPDAWAIDSTTPASTIGFIADCYSSVTLQNTGSTDEYFQVFATYNYQSSVLNITTNYPQVAEVTTNLTANQTAQVVLNYYNGSIGAAPLSLSLVPISVLATSASGTYYVDSVDTIVNPQIIGSMPLALTLSNNWKSFPMGATPQDASNNIVVKESPIQCSVFQNPSNQTYQAEILVENPFAIPLLATVTQPLPSGITILSTDGMLGSSSIVWTNTIPTNGLVVENFTFTLPTMPGAQTNLPAASLVFSDGTGTNSLSVQSLVANFNGLFPVQVSGYVPNGVSGIAVPMQLTLTNLTGTNQTGLLTVSLADQTGTAVTNYSQSFVVGGSGATNLVFLLPGTLPPGNYPVTAALGMYGGSEQVLAGLYVVPLAPVILGFSSTPPLTNGVNLTLQGPVGSNYLIEASSDLVTWTPIINFYATNSPFSFSDPAATNYNQRFYRAVLFDAASTNAPISPSLTFGSAQPLTANGFQMMLSASVGSTCVIQASTNLVDWQTLSQFVVESSTIYFNDPQATNCSQRFYRALTQ